MSATCIRHVGDSVFTGILEAAEADLKRLSLSLWPDDTDAQHHFARDSVIALHVARGIEAEGLALDDQRLRPEKSEVFRLWCDNTKIRELTGFEPKYSIDEGLKPTIDWFLDSGNLSKYKNDIYNV